MDFFAQQDAARKASRRLTVLFILAVLAVVVSVNVVTAIALETTSPALFALVTVVTLVVVLGGSAFKTLQLRDGGSAVAEMMGGRRITSATGDLAEKRLVNVIEEMALASGVPVPMVYIMDHEQGFNAFAAGYSPNDAAIAVTHGLLHAMNRDELQGVIGHEFSHVLNGDMRLNVRMIGLLFGIEMIGHTGRVFMRVADRGRDSRATNGIAGFGLALFVIGAVGVFMANMIRAAIGRQREYLADASAVQFTRNPDGIGSALALIAAQSGVVEHQNADEVSHMFIAAALDSRLDGLFATHPPIETRIEKILGKGARARIADVRKRAERIAAGAGQAEAFGRGTSVPDDTGAISGGFGRGGATGSAIPGVAGFAAGAAGVAAGVGAGTNGFAVGGAGAMSAERLLASVGQPGVQHVDYAKALLSALPDPIRAGLGTAEGAKAIVLAMLAVDLEAGADLGGVVERPGARELFDRAREYLDVVREQHAHLRLPIVSLALPVLRPLPIEERRQFLALARAITIADTRITPFEFALMALAGRALDDSKRTAKPARYADFAPLQAEVVTVLSLFVRLASEGSVLFERLMGWFHITGAQLLAPSAIKMQEVERALERLAEVTPLKKPLLIKACLEAVTADGKVSPREAELMRAVCATLESPLPPVIDVQVVRVLEDVVQPARTGSAASV